MSKWYKVEFPTSHFVDIWSELALWLQDESNITKRWKRRLIYIGDDPYFCYKFKSEFDATAFKLTWL